jgi:hypothetical protein
MKYYCFLTLQYIKITIIYQFNENKPHLCLQRIIKLIINVIYILENNKNILILTHFSYLSIYNNNYLSIYNNNYPIKNT